MHTSLIASTALFAAGSLAQTTFLDSTLVINVVTDANNFVASVVQNPAIITAVSSLESLGVPAASIASAEADPVFLLENLVADYTNIPLIDSIPTALGNTLRSVLTVPLKAVQDIANFITYLEGQPDFQSIIAELVEHVPTDVQKSFSESPIPFFKTLVEGPTIPTYFSAVPTGVVKGVASIINEGLSIVLSDFEAPGNATIVTSKPTKSPNATIPYPTTAPAGVVTGVSRGTGVKSVAGVTGISKKTGVSSKTGGSSKTGVSSKTGLSSGTAVTSVTSATGSLTHGYNHTYASVGTGSHGFGPKPTTLFKRRPFAHQRIRHARPFP